MKNNRLAYITLLRSFAVFCILTCHFLSAHSNIFVSMFSQFFNVGVQIFFVISGFCLGLQGEILYKVKWYLKRIKRIFVSYELFCLLLALIYIMMNLKFDYRQWISLVFGFQGSNVRILGAGQTWFVSSLLLCYFCTPFISELWKLIKNKRVVKYLFIFILIFGLIFISFILPVNYVTTLSPIFFYSIAYILGFENIHLRFNKNTAIIAFICSIIALAIRLLGKFLCDGTILYNEIIVGYTHYALAFSSLVIFAVIFKNINGKSKIFDFINWIDKISFEIYLVHYMFIVGPVSLIHITNYFILNIVVVLMVTLLIAYILNKISGYIQFNFLDNGKQS